jgi:MFS family permease
MPVAAMLAAQAVLSMATVTLPILAPAVAAETGLAFSLLGLFVALIYASSMACGLVSGALVRRWGALRLSQLCLLAASAGVALLTTGHSAGIAAAAVLMGIGYGPLNPASSHLLNRVAPPDHRSRIFSLKQTGVPVGALLAGALLPPLVSWSGWRSAVWTVCGACALLALLLQPLRATLDIDRQSGARVGLDSLAEPLRVALADRAGRPLALSSFCYAALQLCLGTYLVTFLTTQNGYSLVEAGLALAVTQAAGIGGRLLSGHLADRSGQPRRVMGAMGCLMGLCAITSAFASSWPTPLLLLLYAVFGASAIGWNGVYLAEVAQRAPPGAVSAATAAALFVTFAGVLAGPPVLALMIESGMGYGAAFAAVALPALLCGLALLRGARPESH